MASLESLKSEIAQIEEELKDWEMGMSLEWTDAEATEYHQKKRDLLKDFLMNQVSAQEKRAQTTSSTPAATPSGPTEDELIEQEARRQIEAEEAAARAADAALEEALKQEEAAKKAEEEANKKRQEEEARKKAEEEEARKKAEEESRKKVEAEARKKAEEEAKKRAEEAKPSPSPSPSLERASSITSPRVSAISTADMDEAAKAAAAADAALEKEMKEAILRIAKQPVGRQADLTDPGIVSTYIRIRNNRDDLNWMMLGYPDANQPNKLAVIGCGTGGWNEFVTKIPEDAVYIYMDYKFGDTSRSKFVFMTYVPDSLSGMKKSRVVGHRPAVEKLLKYMQLSWHVLEKQEFNQHTLDQKLLAAGGANYSVQEADKGDFTSYKKTTADFYSEKEKTTNISNIVYEKGPLSTTPMDIAGRAMVASPSELRANIVDLTTKK